MLKRSPNSFERHCWSGLILCENSHFKAYCISLFVSLFFVWMCIQRETTWFCCDSSFHFCPTRLQRCPTILLGHSFLLLSIMQIFQQQCSFLVTAPVSCRKPAIIILPCSFLGFFFSFCIFSLLSSTVYLLYKPHNFEKKKKKKTGPTNLVKLLDLI